MMTKPALIVMAAGIGSRYGGLKQIDPVGPSGEIILDYSVFDAINAGFGRVVFVIKEEMEALFREQVGNRISAAIPVDYVHQRLDALPEGFSPPPGRIKPWGTGHAVYCCREIIREPFVVINADDFYGADAYTKVADFLRETDDKHHACMVGYYIENTLTENGSVARGVCEMSFDGYLEGITERTNIKRNNGEIAASDGIGTTSITPGTVVSMNFWGFSMSIMSELESCLSRFLAENRSNLESIEFYLPYFVNELIKDGKLDVKVLETGAKWYGITYREDKASVQDAICKMVESGSYPAGLSQL
jgi:dTDP-glucose pyrophosphorylase